jgi:hypothetical protein
MATLTATGIQDLMNATLEDLGRDRIQQIAQNQVDYPAFNLFHKKERMFLEDGVQIQRNVQIRKTNPSRFVGIGQTDTVSIDNVTTQAKIDWKYCDTHWGFFDQEIMLNRGKSQIFNLIKSRRTNSHIDMVEMINAALWTLPGSSDTKSPNGIPYYIVKNATTGFNGGHPSGYSTVANISRTTYANWKNYTAQYVVVTKGDLITKLRTAFKKCRFRDLDGMTLEDYRKGRDRYMLFVNESVSSDLENIGEAQNENLGKDVAVMEVQTGINDIYRFDGALTFRRKPIVFEPYLDNDTTNPVYGLDLSTWCNYVHKARNMRESEVKEAADQHNAFVVWIDHWFNLLCIDPRRNFVMYV